MNEIIQKIDEEILHSTNWDIVSGLELAKQIIQSEHKEPCEQCNYKTSNLYCDGRCEEGKMKTNFNVITESPGKLANFIHQYMDCKKCYLKNGCQANNQYSCYGRWFDYLNQKAEEE